MLNTVLEHQLPVAQAAEILGVNELHAWRLLAAYRRERTAALAHGNRGRRPHNAVPEAAAAAVVKLASDGCAGANHSHLTELLREREGIDLSQPTVRRILVKAGMGSPRSRRSQQHRFRRKRMPQEGMLIQVDGSPHAWLGERAEKFVLLLAVDDATGVATQAIFHHTEDTRGYLVLLEGLVRQWGIPLAMYSDRHGAFKHNARQGPVLYESTQFARVMQELGIQQIFAMSPQAKGRVERMVSTFQDRLVTELRLAGANNMEEANAVLQEYLPRFNQRFAVAAEQPETACRPVPEICLSPRRLASGTPARWPGTTREVPVAGAPVAAWGGAPFLCRPEGRPDGAGRRGADDPVPGGGRRFPGGGATNPGLMGGRQRHLPHWGRNGGC